MEYVKIITFSRAFWLFVFSMTFIVSMIRVFFINCTKLDSYSESLKIRGGKRFIAMTFMHEYLEVGYLMTARS